MKTTKLAQTMFGNNAPKGLPAVAESRNPLFSTMYIGAISMQMYVAMALIM